MYKLGKEVLEFSKLSSAINYVIVKNGNMGDVGASFIETSKAIAEMNKSLLDAILLFCDDDRLQGVINEASSSTETKY